MSRQIPALHRSKAGIVSNAQSTPTPASTRTTTARGLDTALSTAIVAPLRTIKGRGSLKETAQKVQASVTKKIGTFKPFPKNEVANAETEVEVEEYWQGDTRIQGDLEWRTHKKGDSDGSSMRTIRPAQPAPSSSPQQQQKCAQPTPSIRSATKPLNNAVLPKHGLGGTGDNSPGISVRPSEYAPRSLSPVISESIYSESLVSDGPLISAFAANDLRSVVSEALSADAHMAGRILKDAGLRLSMAVSQHSAGNFEQQAEPLLKVDALSYLEEQRANVNVSSAALPASSRPEIEGSVVSTISSSVEYYSLGAAEMFRSRNSAVKGELELIPVKAKRTREGSSAAPLSAVPPHMKAPRRQTYPEELTPDDSISHVSYSSTASSKSGISKASGTPTSSTRTSVRHRRIVADPVKVKKDEMACFSEARKQLEDDAASPASTASFRTARSAASSLARPTPRREASTTSRSVSVVSTSNTVTSTIDSSMRTPHANDFPAIPLGDIQKVYWDTMQQLQRLAAARELNLDVEAMYRLRFKVALDAQLQTASDQALAQTLCAVGETIAATKSRRTVAAGSGMH